METTTRCRHRRNWLWTLGSNRLQWCYECGSIRDDYGKWVRPVGKGGENPAMKRINDMIDKAS